MIADFVVMTRGNKAALLQAKEQAFDYLEFPRGRTLADGARGSPLTSTTPHVGSVRTDLQRSPRIVPMMVRSSLTLSSRELGREIDKLLEGIPGASEALKRFTDTAIKQAGSSERLVRSGHDTYRQYLELNPESLWGPPVTGRAEIPTADEPNTLDRLIEKAKEKGYTEIYHVYRYRDESRLAPDRLPEATLHAQNVDEAVKKLIAIAGYDEVEAELLGLDEFDAGTILNLCDRLKELTGDTYSVSPYEMPHEP